MTDAADDPHIGKTLVERYHVRRFLGRGGMGAVYEGAHIGLGKRVAIKFLLDRSPDLVARFQREARAASKLEHQHVVQIFDVGTDATGADFMVMEYVEGRDLRRVLEDGPLPLPRALHIAKQLLHALHAIHESGIVHRDIKPANILLTEEDGDSDFVKIMDFGISKVVGGDLPAITKSGHIVGTPQYMAPEVLRGRDADARSDIYAAGLTIYEMLAGTPPFVGNDTTQLAALHLTVPVKPLDEVVAGLPLSVVRAVERALDKSPDMRFPTALAMVQALSGDTQERNEAATVPSKPRPPVPGRIDVATEPSQRRPPSPPPSAAPPPSPSRPSSPAPSPPAATAPARSPLPVYLAAAFIVIAVPLGVYFAMRGDTAPPAQPHRTAATPADAAAPRSKAEQYLATAREADASGHRELAIASYRAYLDEAPSAPDADQITARIVALTPVAPPSPPADAGVADAPRPARRAAPAQYCRCVDSEDRSLCAAPKDRMCRCQLGVRPLCYPEPPIAQICSTGFMTSGTPGYPCQGYLAGGGKLTRGLYNCSRCVEPDTYRGHLGESCGGYDGAGAVREGRLRHCSATPQ